MLESNAKRDATLERSSEEKNSGDRQERTRPIGRSLPEGGGAALKRILGVPPREREWNSTVTDLERS